MRSGPMRYNIEFWSKQNVRDDYSGYEETYKLALCTKADVKHTGGSQQIINDQLYPTSDIKITMRYRKEIVETMRVKFRDEIYGIDYLAIMEPKVGIVLNCSKLLEM